VQSLLRRKTKRAKKTTEGNNMKEDEKMEVKKGMEKEYVKYVNKNQDGYGNAAVTAGAKVGKALTEGKSLQESHDEMYGCDLTGFLSGCVAETIAHFHPRGEEFRTFWNKENGVTDDVKGVVNPAIFAIGEK